MLIPSLRKGRHYSAWLLLYSGVAFPATGLFLNQATSLLGGVSGGYYYGLHNGEMAESMQAYFGELWHMVMLYILTFIGTPPEK
jgi:hypothetical protein